MPPEALILAGFGLNCEEETAHAFKLAGATTKIVHINALAANPKLLDSAQIFTIPGGFSFGDDTGSGNGLAWTLKNKLADALNNFTARDTLTLGICNGCQTLVNIGLLGDVTLTHNQRAHYDARWVHLAAGPKSAASPWLNNIQSLHIPVAHGEGNFIFAEDTSPTPALCYTQPDASPAGGAYPANPNGSIADTAAVTDKTGRILAMMPHPERAVHFTQTPNWPLQKEKLRRNGDMLPLHADGLQLFQNAITYFT